METNDNAITMTQEEYDKAIQSAEDKLRTRYSKEIKDLQDKVIELTPKEKSESEVALEQRLAEVEAKEKRLNLIDTLTSNGLSKDMADYIKDDADVASFGKLIDNLVTTRLADSGYKPHDHAPNNSVTKEQWKKMTYSEREAFYTQFPDVAAQFMKH